MSTELTTSGGGGPNRVFIIIALGLVALLILGVVAVGAFIFIQNQTKPPVPTVAIKVTSTTPTVAVVRTNTPFSIAALPTNTVEAPATATLVVIGPTAGGGTALPPVTATLAASAAITTSATVTGTLGAVTPAGGMPQTGVGEDLLLLAGGIILIMIIFAARRARASTV